MIHISLPAIGMVIKFSIHMSNRYKLKVTKFQSFIYFRKKVIKKKPPPPPPPQS